YGADAMAELARRGAAGGVADPKHRHADAKVLVRVDFDALLGGYPIDGETCELVGYGPVAVSAVKDMIDSGNPFLVAIATKGVDVVGVAHLGRKFTAAQVSALQWRDPTCAAMTTTRRPASAGRSSRARASEHSCRQTIPAT